MAEGTRTVAERLSLVGSHWANSWTDAQRIGWSLLLRKFNPVASLKEKKRLLREAESFLKLHQKNDLLNLLN